MAIDNNRELDIILGIRTKTVMKIQPKLSNKTIEEITQNTINKMLLKGIIRKVNEQEMEELNLRAIEVLYYFNQKKMLTILERINIGFY